MKKLYDIAEPGATIKQGDGISTAVPFAVGIDLGTTNSLVAIVEKGKPHVIADAVTGKVMLPSVVEYIGNNVRVGSAGDAVSTKIASVKRLISRSPKEIATLQPHTPYPLQASTDNKYINVVTAAGEKSPVEISAEILKVLKRRAEEYLDQPVHHAVITVPAYFNEAGRVATKQAAQLAGLQVLRVLNEPTAAALAFGVDQKVYGTYLVFDLGGGTFDVSIIRFAQGVFHVIATAGDIYLGGDDLDLAIVADLKRRSPNEDSLERLLPQARNIKESLTLQAEWRGPFGDATEYILNRREFEQLMVPYAKRISKILYKVLSDAGLDATAIDEVLMVGGATRIPYIRQLVTEIFGKAPLTSFNPDEIVAVGAAIQASHLTYGSDTTLLDVTPLSLGIELNGGIVEVLIPRNTPIPTECVQKYATMQDNQTAFIVHIVQGEGGKVDKCMSLARFELRGFPPLTAGQVKLEVRFRIDVDGLLIVDTHVTPSDVHHEVVVKPSYGLDAAKVKELMGE